MGETELPKDGPTSPDAVIMKGLQREARLELAAKEGPAMPRLFDPFMEEELSASGRGFGYEEIEVSDGRSGVYMTAKRDNKRKTGSTMANLSRSRPGHREMLQRQR